MNEKIDPLAEVYQAFASLADLCGMHGHPEVVRALDFLAYPDKRDVPLTPWPREPLPDILDTLSQARAYVSYVHTYGTPNDREDAGVLLKQIDKFLPMSESDLRDIEEILNEVKNETV